MKQFLKLSIVLVGVILFFGCSEEQQPDSVNGEFEAALEELVSKGLVKRTKVIDDVFFVTYSDDIVLSYQIEDLDDISIYDHSGVKIFNALYLEEDDRFELDIIESRFNQNRSENPDHDGQDFCECYKNDVEEFCDGIVGCVALISGWTHIAILAHCAAKTKFKKCETETL